MTFHRRRSSAGVVCVGLVLALSAASSALAQTAHRRLAQIELSVLGVSASVEPLEPVVPKNIASAVRIVVRNGDRELSASEVARFLGTGWSAQAELSGPGLSGTITLPYLRAGETAPSDPLLLPLPALAISGEYALSNIRLVSQGASALDVVPSEVVLKVIEQVLVTSVKTRPLSMDEILAKGIVLDSDDYLGFEFTLGLALESEKIEMTLPVVFDRNGDQVPLPPLTGRDVFREGVRLPTISVVMLSEEVGGGGGGPTYQEPKTPAGEPIRIPSVLVIPGNIGYLKQFFSAQLYVANGAPGGSNLVVRDVTGKINLPPSGALSLPELSRDGQTITQPATMPVRGVGADSLPGTEDDAVALAPGEQGQAEFILRGEQEGFHTIEFDIGATLEGLPIGPVKVSGKAKGGVLVRNAYLDVSFTVPSVVRKDETFPMYVTLTNTGKGWANGVNVYLDQQTMSGVELVEDESNPNPALAAPIEPGGAQTVKFLLRSLRTGQVYATYLNFDTEGELGPDHEVTGGIHFRIGVGERGVPLSPDTLTLPSSVGNLPADVVSAAMRVLGQAWSIANAAAGTLPTTVRRIPQTVVVNKARALAEAGLRVDLGESQAAAVRDLLIDFYGGESVDPGFDQLLRKTVAGRDLARALGAELESAAGLAGGAIAYERELAGLGASGPDFVSFAAVGAGALDVSLTDASGNALVFGRDTGEIAAAVPRSELPGGVLLPLGPVGSAPILGFVSRPNGGRYALSVSGAAEVALTYPSGVDTFARALITTNGPAEIVFDLSIPSVVRLRQTVDGSVVESDVAPSESLVSQGPALLSANVIGRESFEGASEHGTHVALLFDRIVDAEVAKTLDNYSVPVNEVQWAQRQLSGRLVFLRLRVPEGSYVPTHVDVKGVRDWRGVAMAAAEVALGTRITAPGAIVTGRVVNADGTSAGVDHLYYNGWDYVTQREIVVANVPVAADGSYEIRYVRQPGNGVPFRLVAVDPSNGMSRQVEGYVRAPGERIVLDIALLGKGSVTGIVTRAEIPVGGAQVAVRSEVDRTMGGNATTDASGRYTVSGITVGPVTVRAQQDQGLGYGWGRIDRAGATATVNVALDDTGRVSVSGTVQIVRQGSPPEWAAGALVVYSVMVSSQHSDPVAYTYVAEDGTYSFTGMPLGDFQVKAATSEGAAYYNGTGVPDTVITGANLVIRIESKGVVRGIVRYPDGSPAAGVYVAQGISSPVIYDAVLTADDGTFALPGIPIGRSVSIGATTRDRLRTGTTLVAIPLGSSSVDGAEIRLSEMGDVEFLVLDPAGTPLANQQVRLMTNSLQWGGCQDPCGCGAQNTDSTGRVRYKNLPLGTYEARAVRSLPGYTDMAQGKATARGEGDLGQGVLRFEGAGTVSGAVLQPVDDPDDGETTTGTGGKVALTSRVFVHDPASGMCDFVEKVSHKGYVNVETNEFVFTNVNVGRVSVLVDNPFFPPAGARGVLARNGDELHLEVQLVDKTVGDVSGTIFLPDGVTPAGAGVEVSFDGSLPTVTGKTDETGHYRVASVMPEGPYAVTVLDPVTGGVAKKEVRLVADQDLQLDLRLLGRGTVRVAVEDATGQLAERATVELRETHYPNRTFEAVIEPNDQGVAVLEGVFEGTFAVEASDVFGRGGRANGTVPAPDETVDIVVTLNATGTVHGRFLRPEQGALVPVPYGIVKLRHNGAAVAEATTSSAADTLGEFTFDYVKSGSGYSLEAVDPLTLRSGKTGGITVPEQGTVEADVTAQGLGTVKGRVTRSYAGGEPVGEEGARVDVTSGNLMATTRTIADGQYQVVGIPEGEITVKASIGTGGSQGFLMGVSTGTLAGNDSTVTINVALRDSTGVCGVVRTAQGGVLNSQTFVRVKLRVGGVGGDTQETITGVGGGYCFSVVPAGTATIDLTSLTTIDRQHVEGVVIDPDQAVNGSVQLDPINLNGIGSISGRARRGNGDGVTARLYFQSTGGLLYSTQGLPDADGGYTIPQFLVGPFSADMYVQDDFTLRGTATGTLVAGTDLTGFDVVLEPNAEIRGHVMASAEPGAPGVAGATVVLRLGGNRGSATVLSGLDGEFRYRGVPVGEHTVFATAPDGQSTGGGPVSIAAGDEGATLTPTITLETDPVRVEAMTPDSGTPIAVDTPVTLTFSSPLRWASGFKVMDGTKSVGVVGALSADGRTVTLRSSSGYRWPDGRLLTVVATTDVTDIFGRHPATEWTGTFRTIDVSPASVVSTVPGNKAIEVNVPAITVTYSEPLSAPPTAEVKRSGQVVAISAPALDASAPNVVHFQIQDALITDSTYYVSVSGAVDQSGNTQTVAKDFTFKTRDTVPPTINLSQPSTPWVRTVTPTIAVSYSDATSGIDSSTAKIWLDGTLLAITAWTNVASHTPPEPLAEGTHTVTARVADRAGHVADLSARTLGIDLTPPTAPTTTSVTSGQTLIDSVPMSVDASDATSGITKIDILLDGQYVAALAAPAACGDNPSVTCTVTGSFATRGRAEGAHTLTLRAVDRAGNSTTGETIPIIIDNNQGVISGVVSGPVAGPLTEDVVVSFYGVSTTVSAGSNGEYQLVDVPMNVTYNLDAKVNGQVRARIAGVQLTAARPTLTDQNLTLIGVGTMSGVVTLNSQARSGATVRLQYQAANGLTGTLQTTTPADGTYSFTNAPVGDVWVWASYSTYQSAQEKRTIANHGDIFAVNLALNDSAVVVPAGLYDGNALVWQVRAGGNLYIGYTYASTGNSPRLTITPSGTTNTEVFTGVTCPSSGTCYAPTEESKRELVLAQTAPIAGLSVTRKVYVPADGYFVRHLETLTNPGTESITVDVVQEATLNELASRPAPTVVSSSAGAADALTVEDRWAVLDDSDTGDPYASGSPSNVFFPLASAFAGEGGLAPVEASLSGKTLRYRWANVEVPAGETVALMLLLSGQADRGRGQAAAERLAQLPPEVLAGLSLEEARQIKNFVIPADLASALTPLPANDGKIEGRVLTGDGVTGVRDSTVSFRSRSPYYGRRLSTSALDCAGSSDKGCYSLKPSLTGGAWTLMPRGEFDITATSPSNVFVGATSVSATGDLTTDQTSFNLVFAGLGAVVARVVDRQGNVLNDDWADYALEGGGRSQTGSNSAGTMLFRLVPPGPYTLSATYKGMTVAESIDVPADSLHVDQDLVIPALGQITVNVTSSGTGFFVDVQTMSGTRATYCNTGGWGGNGSCTFSKLPAADYRIVVYGNNVNVKVSETVTLTDGAQLTVPITLPDLVTVSGTVFSRDGVGQPATRVYAYPPEGTTYYAYASVSGTPGTFSLTNIPVWPIRLRTSYARSESSGTLYYYAEVPLNVTGTMTGATALLPWGALATSIQRDLWQFTVGTAGTKTITLIKAPVTDNVLDPLLEIYDSNGALVASNDNISTSNHDARISFTAEPGTYTAVVRAAAGSIGAYRLGGASSSDDYVFRPLDNSVVAGRVVDDTDAPSPVAGLTVRLLRDGLPTQSDVTDALGHYFLPLIPLEGDYVIEVVEAAGVVIASINRSGANDNQDIVVPAHGTVSVTVAQGTVPLAGVDVSFVSDHPTALEADRERTAPTNSEGVATAWLPYGHVTASATYEAVTLGSEDDLDAATLTLPNIVFASSISTIQGRVANGDNVTPLPGATVTLTNGMTATTAADGTYTIPNVPPGTYDVTASFAVPNLARTINGVQTISVAGGSVPLNFQLGVPVITGTVGDPSAGPAAIAATVTAYNYSTDASIVVTAAPDGRYVIYGRPSWDNTGTIRLYATAPENSNVRSSIESLTSYTPTFTGTLVRNPQLPASGVVQGTVFGPDGTTPLSGAEVHSRDEYSGERVTSTNAQGQYYITHLPARTVNMYAFDADGIPGESPAGAGAIVVGTPLVRDITIGPSGQLTLRLLDSEGQLQAGPVTVQLPALPIAGTRLEWSRSYELTSESIPSARTVRVPPGFYWATYDDGVTPPAAAEGDLAVDQTQAVELHVGSHVRLPYILSGTGASYCAGAELYQCWQAGADLVAADMAVYALSRPAPALAGASAEGRVLTGLSGIADQVRVRRDYYVPPSGAFARTLTWFENTSETDTVSVEVTTQVPLPGCEVATTSSGDSVFDTTDAFVVMGPDPTLALVVGSAQMQDVSSAGCSGGGEMSFYVLYTNRTITLGPGDRKALLAFDILDKSASVSDVVARAQLLTDLTLSDALFGLSAAERAAIVNFNVPEVGSISGNITHDGAAVADARVAAVTATGMVVAETVADAAGAFLLENMAVGTYDLLAYDAATQRPGTLRGVVVGNSEADIELSATPVGLVTIEAVGMYDGQPIAGASVVLSASGFSPFWRPVLTLDGLGRTTFANAPLGAPLVARVAPPAESDAAAVTLTGGEDPPPTLTVHVIQTMTFPVELSTPAGSYFVFGDGGVSPTSDYQCQPFCGTWAIPYGTWFEATDRGGILPSGREVAAGPQDFSNIRVTRRAYVPEDGRFVRFLDLIDNPTPDDVTMLYQTEGDMQARGGAAWSVAATSAPDEADVSVAPDDNWVLFTAPGTEVVGLVTAGSGAGARPDALLLDGSSDWAWLQPEWGALIVPARGRAIVMQFAVVRPEGATESALEQVRALANLSDAGALAGMTPLERSQVVNFLVP